MAQLIKAHGGFLRPMRCGAISWVCEDGLVSWLVAASYLGVQVVLPVPFVCFLLGTLPEVPWGGMRCRICRISSKEVSHEDIFEMNLS